MVQMMTLVSPQMMKTTDLIYLRITVFPSLQELVMLYLSPMSRTLKIFLCCYRANNNLYQMDAMVLGVGQYK